MVKKRYPLLDLLRWIAAIMVATLHWSLEIGPQIEVDPISWTT
jgi:peptidoglycan/LPS O-acetylase OafA/YrhL